jgi:hypothetical protein
MAEQLAASQPNHLQQQAEDILEQCRLYSEFYERHIERGVPAEYDGSKWKVVYWPNSESVDERLSVTRGVTREDHPVSYTIHPDGVVTKCAVLREMPLASDRLFFDTMHEQAVTDPGELDTLMGVVATTNALSS